MPTSRPRHQVTETDEVGRALDLAARRWPDEQRSRLLLRLIDAGATAVRAEVEAEVAARLALVDELAAKYTGVFEPGFLEKLREDWPE